MENTKEYLVCDEMEQAHFGVPLLRFKGCSRWGRMDLQLLSLFVAAIEASSTRIDSDQFN